MAFTYWARHLVHVGDPADDLPRDPRPLGDRPAPADRGDGGVGGDLPVSLHPAHLRDEARLRLGRPARQPGARGAQADRRQGRLPERQVLRRPDGRSTSSWRSSSPGASTAGRSSRTATGDVMLLQKQRNLGGGRAAVHRAWRITFARVRLADEPEPDLVLDGVRRLLLRRQHRRGAVAAGDHHQARAGGERVRREHERRAHAQHRQADAGVHLLLDLHRVLPADAHLDRRAPRRDAVLHHPLQPRLGAASASSSSSGHFFIPFGALLSRSLKRSPTPAGHGRGSGSSSSTSSTSSGW